jgi:hypothetical protein
MPINVFTTLDEPLADQSIGRGTFPLDINDAGQIVRNYRDAHGVTHGFLLSGGTFTTFDDPLIALPTASTAWPDRWAL